MSEYLEVLKNQTRWANISEVPNAFRLLCSDPECSLSCANLRNGKISVTSMHGTDRHSYVLSKKDMAFVMCMFLNSLTEKELHYVCHAFTKCNPEYVLTVDRI